MSGGQAPYLFLPWLRRGLAASIAQDATETRATLDVRLQMRAGKRDLAECPSKQIALYGPGDILGFDARIVVRTEPRPSTGDFEPNCFPFIEFAEPDFPWRFSAFASPTDDAKDLLPWITLIVVRVEEVRGDDDALSESELLREYRDPESQTPWIEAKSSALPDLNQTGRWAHVQVTGYEPELNAQRLATIIDSEPERLVSRLLCARRLRAGVKYHAYVVPTFALGVVAADSGYAASGEAKAKDLAWSGPGSGLAEGGTIELPYYYKWEFRTGRSGDFEDLVRRLRPRELTGLGLSPVDCSHPGYSLEGVPDALGFESALRSVDTVPTKWGEDSGAEEEFQKRLASLLEGEDGSSSPTGGASTDDDPPPVVPPLYGRWYRTSPSLNASPNEWFKQLNLDPRHRWAAGLGAEVVRRQQEPLMASAWDQLGDIIAANDLLRRAQFGTEVSTKAEARLNRLSTGDYLRIAAPLLGLVKAEPVEGAEKEDITVERRIFASPIGKAPMDPALRRVARKRGVLRKRQEISRIAKTTDEPKSKVLGDLLLRLNLRPQTTEKMDRLPDRPIVVATKTLPVRGVPSPKRIASTILATVKELPTVQERAVKSAQSAATPPNSEATKAPKERWIADLEKMRVSIKARLKPAKTIAARVQRRIQPDAAVAGIAPAGESAGAPTEEAPSLAPIKTAPEFPQPMWNALEELSQQHLLAGIEQVPQNTVALVETNRRFVEAFLCGLNHEFSRELLWREYPSDQRGTYFRQFWDKSGLLPGASSHDERLADIPRILQWNKPLGSNSAFREGGMPGGTDGEPDGGSLVLLIRGDLLNKYPNAAIYALKGDLAGEGGGSRFENIERRLPMFALTAKPDIACVGFNLSAEAAIDDGWHLVIEERISETRFGLDISGGGAVSDLSWEHFEVAEDDYLNGKEPYCFGPLGSAASVASKTLQRAVRVIISAKQMIPPIGRLSGLVESTDGRPVTGATVTVGNKSVETAQDGTFALRGLEIGRGQVLSVRQPDFEPEDVRVDLTARELKGVKVQLTLLPGRIGGAVTDHRERGLGGVSISYAGGNETAISTPSGAYELADVPVGEKRVTAQLAGYGTETREVTVVSKQRAELDFALTPTTGTITGTILDHLGRGLPAARIAAGGKETWSTAPTGVYELPGVPVGRHRISVEKNGFLAQEQSIDVVGGESASLSFKLILIPTTGTISGKVTGASNAPLSGVTVTVANKTITSTNDEFSLRDVPVGDWTVTFSHPKYFPKTLSVTLEGGETEELNVALALLPGSVEGTVRSLGLGGKASMSPVKGASVTLGSRATTTDTYGKYRFSNVPAGRYQVNVTYPGCTAIGAPRTLDVQGGGRTESGVDFGLMCPGSTPTPSPKPTPKPTPSPLPTPKPTPKTRLF